MIILPTESGFITFYLENQLDTNIPPHLTGRPWLPQSDKATFPSWAFAPGSECCESRTWLRSKAGPDRPSQESLPGSLYSWSRDNLMQDITSKKKQLNQLLVTSQSSTSSSQSANRPLTWGSCMWAPSLPRQTAAWQHSWTRDAGNLPTRSQRGSGTRPCTRC